MTSVYHSDKKSINKAPNALPSTESKKKKFVLPPLTPAQIARKKKLKAQYDEQLQHLKGQSIQLIVFTLGQGLYALEIDEVKEAVPTPNTSQIPHAPTYIKGLANIRGTATIVIDLEEKFALRDSSHIRHKTKGYTLVIKSEKHSVGVLVQEVPTTLKVSGDTIEKSSGMISHTALDDTFIKGLIKKDENMIMLINMEELIENSEIRLIHPDIKNSQKQPQKSTHHSQ